MKVRMNSVVLLAILSWGPAAAQTVITTVAGTEFLFTADGRPATQAQVGFVGGVAVSPGGDIYFSSTTHSMAMRLARDGRLSIIAGNGIRAFSGDGGPGVNASLFSPAAVALDAAGNLYIADSGNHRIRRVAPDGTITTVAGNGVRAFAGDGSSATAASLNAPEGVSVAPDGSLLIADTRNQRIRRVAANGVITTIAGTGTVGYTGDFGQATAATFENPREAIAAPNGVVYIADTSNSAVRRIDAAGMITTYAGIGFPAFFGDDGPAFIAALRFPEGLALDGQGRLYIADAGNHRIRRVTPDGTITTVAGSGATGFGGDGGPANAAALNTPVKVALDSLGNFYVADFINRRLRLVSAAGVISTAAGNGEALFSGDGGPATSAAIDGPLGVALDRSGNLYFTDTLNHRVRRVAASGTITTIAGDGQATFRGDGGPATSASLNLPVSLAIDNVGNVYIADFSNGRVRRVATNGMITTVAGDGGLNFFADNVQATAVSLAGPYGIGLDSANNLYIAEIAAERVRKVTPAGSITTIAGQLAQSGFAGDNGPATAAKLNSPAALVVDAANNVYVSDQNNHRVRRINAAGMITTVAGNGQRDYKGDGGQATAASLAFPRGLALDTAQNLYITDQSNYVIRRVAPGGIITTIAGNGFFGFFGDGRAPLDAVFDNPQDVAVDAAGNVYIADSGNDRIRAVLTASPAFQAAPAAITLSAKTGGPRAAPRTVSLIGSIPGLSYAVTTATSSGGGWLIATPTGGSMPGVLQVTADPGQLAPGTYLGAVTITSAIANPAVRIVSVSFTVDPADPAQLSVTPENLSFSFTQGDGAGTQTLSVANRGGGSIAFTATVTTAAGGAWLGVTPGSGTATSTTAVVLTARVDPTRLNPGTYSGAIAIAGPTPNLSRTVAVTATVNPAPQTMVLSQRGLTFTAVEGGTSTLPQSFGVLNTGRGIMSWSAVANTLSGGAGWLTVAPSSGSSDAASPRVPQVQVTANPRGFTPGEYYGRIEVTSATAVNSPQEVSVVMEVLPAGTLVGPAATPGELIFTGVSGGVPTGSQSILVYNLSQNPITFRSRAEPWITRLPGDGTIAPDRPAQIVVQPDPSRLAAGVLRGTVSLQFSDGSVRNVNVLFVVTPAPPAANSARQLAGCTPSTLVPVFASLAQGFSVRAAWPTPLEVIVADNCGDRVSTGSVVATFSNGDPPLGMQALRDGRWSATWQARNAGVQDVTVTVSAEAPGAGLKGTTQVIGGLRASASPPQVAGVVSAASFAAQAPLAPGSMVSIFGQGLSQGIAQASDLPLPSEMAGVRATLAGRPLPLLYASDGQVNAVIPYGIPANTQHLMLLRRGSSYSTPVSLTVAAAQPAIFTRDQSGRGQGVILTPAFQYLAPGNPARSGDVIVIYCAGLGEVDPAAQAGTAAPVSPLSGASNEVALTIGGVRAQVLFAGLAPGFANLYQVNATVPAGVAAGDAVPVVLQVAGQSSPPVTMAVR